MISLNEWIVIEREDKTFAVVRVAPGNKIKAQRLMAEATDVLGTPYGSTFEIMPNGKAQRVINPIGGPSPSPSPPPVDERNNSQLFDRISNQRLDQDDVKRLRVGGKSGGEIVAALVENSETFASKTHFSQEKYIKRLKSKHLARFTVAKCTARSIAEVQFLKNVPSRTEDKLRRVRWYDTLPLILSYANIHAASRVMVLDGVGGMVAMAIMERLDDEHGRLIQLGTKLGETMAYQPAMSQFLNISPQSVASRVVNIPIGWLPGVTEPRAPLPVLKPPAVDVSSSSSSSSSDVSRSELFALRNVRQAEIVTLLVPGGEGADSLVIASPHDPCEAIRVLFPFLGLGQPFVIHSPTVEPLIQCREYLLDTGMATSLNVFEAWCREYQTLEQRSHPLMVGSATGGFLLKGYKVEKLPSWNGGSDSAAAVAAAGAASPAMESDDDKSASDE